MVIDCKFSSTVTRFWYEYRLIQSSSFCTTTQFITSRPEWGPFTLFGCWWRLAINLFRRVLAGSPQFISRELMVCLFIALQSHSMRRFATLGRTLCTTQLMICYFTSPRTVIRSLQISNGWFLLFKVQYGHHCIILSSSKIKY